MILNNKNILIKCYTFFFFCILFEVIFYLLLKVLRCLNKTLGQMNILSGFKKVYFNINTKKHLSTSLY